jgi:hypothetical protein
VGGQYGEGSHTGLDCDGVMVPFGSAVPFDLGGGDGCPGVSDESPDQGSIPVSPVPTSDGQSQGSAGERCGKESVDSDLDSRLEVALGVSKAFFFLLDGYAYGTPP